MAMFAGPSAPHVHLFVTGTAASAPSSACGVIQSRSGYFFVSFARLVVAGSRVRKAPGSLGTRLIV